MDKRKFNLLKEGTEIIVFFINNDVIMGEFERVTEDYVIIRNCKYKKASGRVEEHKQLTAIKDNIVSLFHK